MSDLLDAEGAIERVLAQLASHTEYADALAEASAGARFRLEKDAQGATAFPNLRGVIFRAWTGERWAETVARSVEERELSAAGQALIHQLASSPARLRPPPGKDPSGNMERRTEAKRPIRDVSQDEILARLKGWQSVALAAPGIANAFASISYLTDDRLFRSSSGARRFQHIERVHAAVTPLAIGNGRVEYDSAMVGATAGFERFEEITDEEIRARCATARDLLSAGAPPSGRMPVLLDPSMAGTFAHESFGHGTEADQMLRKRSYLEPLLGQEVGPKMLTIVDQGDFDRGWGDIYFDDEGTPAQRTVLVDKGRFVEALHDRESAAALGRQPTGNARRADFLSRTFVRMTNTFIESGEMSVDELAKEAGDGILLVHATSGIEDPLGGQMQLKCKLARRIEHGKLTTLHSSMALSGKVLEFLRAIRGVGRADAFEMDPGFCGKGHTDLLPAGTGGTYLLSEAVVGPS
jgi:TldD protein